MKRYTLFLALLCALMTTYTVSAQRVYRSEFVTYNTREDARAGKRTDGDNYLTITPLFDSEKEGVKVYVQHFDIPASWNDYNAYLHLENTQSAYLLMINGEVIAEVEDDRTPADFMVSPWLRQGENTLIVALYKSNYAAIQQQDAHPERKIFEGSYLFTQRKLHIFDFSAEIVPNDTREYGILELDVIAKNNFNYEEIIAIGYDIYGPDGNLIDYTVRELTIPGRSCDTLRIRADIYHSYKYKWGGNRGQAPLYSMMLYVKRNGMIYEYIPFKRGFGRTEYADGNVLRFDEPVNLVRRRYVAAATESTTATEIAEIKREGANTLVVDYPQPAWFYSLCDKMGMYVIDRANINAPKASTDRAVGGTPSNDPALCNEYIERVKAMYYRSRNHSCIVGFMLGGKAGNGYNMYKAYEYLTSVEERRPVIYEAAEGEWNSDSVKLTLGK